MIFPSLLPTVGILTLGTVALVCVSAVVLIMLFVMSFAAIVVIAKLIYHMRSRRREQEDAGFDGASCENQHKWITCDNEQGTLNQRSAYYGALSLSAQNSPVRHLRSASTTNPPTHFLSPSHIRNPRRNSSPPAQNHVVGGMRNLSPHTHVINLSHPYPVQPPYWDAEKQQYFHSYGHDSTHASPKCKASSRSPSRGPLTSSATSRMQSKVISSPSTRRSSQPVNPLTTGPLVTAATTSKKLTDYSNLYLPHAVGAKSKLLQYGDMTTTGNLGEAELETSAGTGKEDVLEVTQDKKGRLQAILSNKRNLSSRIAPTEEDNEFSYGVGRDGKTEEEERTRMEMTFPPVSQQQSVALQQSVDLVGEKHEAVIELMQERSQGEEKHFSEVN